MPFYTPLRYPGGKRKLLDFLQLVFKENSLLDSSYVEPYAGGAGLALGLMFNEYVRDIYLNDLDFSIFSFWHSVLDDTDRLCKMILETTLSMEEWNKQRHIQENSSEYSTLEVGFSTFYLNRTNRSGILKGGVIGGKNQTGNWKLDARYNKHELVERIRKIAYQRKRIHLSNDDALVFLESINNSDYSNMFIYLDPPYFQKGKDLYVNYYNEEDHKSVSTFAQTKLKHPWIISYDNVEFIRQLYPNNKHIIYDINYCAADRYKGAEVMFFSNKLVIPNLEYKRASMALYNIR